MKICFIADGRSPSTISWVNYFCRQGHSVSLISSRECDPGLFGGATVFQCQWWPDKLAARMKGSAAGAGKSKPRVRPTTRLGGALFRFSDSWMQPVKGIMRAGWVRRLVERVGPDLVHALRIPIEGEMAALAGCRPLICSVWGNDFTLLYRESPLHALLTRRLLQRMDGIMSDCHADIGRASEVGLPPGIPRLVVPGSGGIQRGVFCRGPFDAGFCRGLGIPEGAAVILNPRGYRRYIRHDTFWRAVEIAARKVKNLFVVGMGLKGFPDIEKEVYTRGLAGRTVLTGMLTLTQEEVAELYRRAAVMVSLAEHDGTPNTLLQALATGCFPICGDLPSIREWIVDGHNGRLVDVNDPEGVAEAIVDAVGDEELRNRVATINEGIIAERADYEQCMPRAELFYQEVLERSRSGAVSEVSQFAPSIAAGGPSKAERKILEPAAYFTSIASQWGEKYVEGGSLRPRVEQCLKPLRGRLGAGSKVLDFGCGSGQITLALEKAGYSVTGMDASAAMVEAARRTCAGTGIEFFTAEPGAWSKIPVKDATCDAVVASSVLEYVLEPAEQIRELARVLRDGGVLVMTVPNPSHPGRVVERPLRMVATTSLMKKVIPLLPKKLEAYLGYLALSINHFSLSTWVNMLGMADLRIDEISERKSPLVRIVATKAAAGAG